jgi:hypothetical protein
MTRTPNDRDRLALTFAELNSHGILAGTALPTTVERGQPFCKASSRLGIRADWGLMCSSRRLTRSSSIRLETSPR